MVSKLTLAFALTCVLASVQAYSGGAPPDVCEDMVPKHPVQPQKTQMPYTVKVDKDTVKPGQIVKITISGREGFKGVFVQVRQNKKDTAIGQFAVADKDKYIKSISCGQNRQNAATHKNSENKNNLTFEWKAPSDVKGTVTVYVTVARDGGTFWTAKPTATIKIN